MSNYKQTEETSTLTKWYAVKLIQCFNEYNKPPKIQFQEVERTALNGELIAETYTNRPLISTADDTRFQEIPYINLETFEQIPEAGHFTPDEIYYALACLYIAAARAADRA